MQQREFSLIREPEPYPRDLFSCNLCLELTGLRGPCTLPRLGSCGYESDLPSKDNNAYPSEDCGQLQASA